jgi:hypothetical protein
MANRWSRQGTSREVGPCCRTSVCNVSHESSASATPTAVVAPADSCANPDLERCCAAPRIGTCGKLTMMSDAAPALVRRRVIVTGLAGSGKARSPSRSLPRPACRLFISTFVSGSPAGLHRRRPNGARCNVTCSPATLGSQTATTTRHSISGSNARKPLCARHALVAVRTTRVPAWLPNAGRVARRVRLFGLDAVAR